MYGVAEVARSPLTHELPWYAVVNAVGWLAIFVGRCRVADEQGHRAGLSAGTSVSAMTAAETRPGGWASQVAAGCGLLFVGDLAGLPDRAAREPGGPSATRLSGWCSASSRTLAFGAVYMLAWFARRAGPARWRSDRRPASRRTWFLGLLVALASGDGALPRPGGDRVRGLHLRCLRDDAARPGWPSSSVPWRTPCSCYVLGDWSPDGSTARAWRSRICAAAVAMWGIQQMMLRNIAPDRRPRRRTAGWPSTPSATGSPATCTTSSATR